MKYENPKIPEGINYSNDNPLKELAILGAAVFGGLVVIIICLMFMAEYLARTIPFSVETSLAEKFQDNLPTPLAPVLENAEDTQQVTAWLQELADQLAEKQGLPDDMPITVHYSDSATVNAFATLGGHIYMFRGLVEQLPSENALAMVMAHEIAHIKHRDPIVALGRGVTVMLALSAFSGVSDSAAMQSLLNFSGNMTVLGFNRKQENLADVAALETLQAYYGHTSGAEALFTVLGNSRDNRQAPEFFSTHPLDEKRIARVLEFQSSHQQKLGDLVPLTLLSVNPGEAAHK